MTDAAGEACVANEVWMQGFARPAGRCAFAAPRWPWLPVLGAGVRALRLRRIVSMVIWGRMLYVARAENRMCRPHLPR
jgi:hypothetical protein